MITQPVAALNRPQPSSSKSLTPQRKHRKLLKDGSGTEVWPEAIEKVFVQGLKEYWRSPFATYSRGRSRYRNQFLVEHLARAGITRTKKQVASHIQVLRNMWKGEPAFHLVAGGEELSTDSAIPNAHFDDHPFYDFGDCDSNSTSDYSPPEIKNEFPSPPSLAAQFTPDSVASSTSLPSLHASPESMHARLDPQHQPYSSHIGQIYHQSSPPPASSNHVLSFHLDADGMVPFIVNLDAHSTFTGTSYPAMTMKTKLYLPTFNSHSNSGGPRGFHGAISLASTFAAGTCTTQVFHGQNAIHRETAPFYPSLDQNGLVTAFLPDSPLSRCRDYGGSPLTYAVSIHSY
ncbi:hypothetical protein ONZ45_g2780 [Pleurotus djamor]|nr:hypothetical protein ONZ45_g2780 [Pleurotus djamor]